MLEDRSLQSHSKARLWVKKYLESKASREDFFAQTPWGLAIDDWGIVGKFANEKAKGNSPIADIKGLCKQDLDLKETRWKLSWLIDRLQSRKSWK